MREWLKAKNYADVARFYDGQYEKAHGEAFLAGASRMVFFNFLNRFYGKLNDATLLDCGCGNGEWLNMFYDRYPLSVVVGIDLSPKALQYAEKKLTDKGIVFELPIEKAPLAWRGYFDIVTSFGVLEHTMNVKNSFKALMECLKPGGIALITVPVDDSENCFAALNAEENQITNERFASAEEWVRVFSEIKAPFYTEMIGTDICLIFRRGGA